MIFYDTSYNAIQLVFISACIKAENDWKKLKKKINYVTFLLPPVLFGGGQYCKIQRDFST